MHDDEEAAALDRVEIVVGESFSEFFSSEYHAVLGLAVVLTRDRGVAEDLTMDAFAAALGRWDTVSEMDSPGAWVRRVLSNAAVSRLRRLGAEARALLKLREPVRDDPLPDPEVWEAVRRLPRRQAQCVALQYVAGYSRAEIAEVLGISEESVKTHLSRARRRLGEVLGDG